MSLLSPPWKGMLSFIWSWTNMNLFDQRILSAKFGGHWPKSSWEENENVKNLQTDRWVMDNRKSESSFQLSLGELKSLKYVLRKKGSKMRFNWPNIDLSIWKSVSRLHIVSNNIKKIKQIYSLDSCLQREGQQDRWMTNNWKWWFQYTPKYVYGSIDTNIEIYIEIKNQANLFTRFMSTNRGIARQMDDKQLEMVIPIYPQICIWG